MDDVLQFRNLCSLKPSIKDAVVFHNGNVSEVINYNEFLSLQNKLTAQIRKIIGPSNKESFCVGVYAEPSIYLPVMIHSLIDLSLIFVPLSLECNQSSLNHSFGKCGMKYVIVDDEKLPTFLAQVGRHLSISSRIHQIDGFNSILVMVELDLDKMNFSQKNMAYVVQSSGSTGKPKMIFVPEKCIIPNVKDLRDLFSITCDDVIFIPSSLTFDASILQMLVAWSSQATMVLIPEKLYCCPDKLASTLSSLNLSIIQCTPSFLHLIGSDLLKKTLFHKESKLRVLALGGERFPPKETVRKWLSNATFDLFNIYGTSELSSWATIHQISELDLIDTSLPNDCDWVPIGRPLSKTCIEIRSEQNKLVTNGAGQIWIGGNERTCYVDDMETKVSMRFTGDIGKVVDDRIYYCGRIDNRIKHNGYLIDLDLLCMVVERKCDFCYCLFEQLNHLDKKQLTLFVKPKIVSTSLMETECDILSVIRKELSPAYVPQKIIFVEQFAVTSHGKIDKHALKNNPSILPNSSYSYSIKEILSFTWNAALGLAVKTNIAPDDNFVASGGNSFTAVYLLNTFLKYISDRQSSDIVNIGEIFEYILMKTYNELLNYVSILLQKDTNEEKMTNITAQSKKMKCDTLEKCYHFIAYQKQARTKKCTCFHERLLYPSPSPITSNIHGNVLTLSWNFSLSKCIDASPLIVFDDKFQDGVVFIGSHSHTMVAVNFKNGNMIWKVVLGDRIESSAAMCYGGDLIAVGCYDGYVYFLKAYTGEIYWRYYTGDTVKSTPVSELKYGMVIVGSHGKKIHALDVTCKNWLWMYDCDSSCFSTPFVDEELECVYIALLSGQVSSLCIKTGHVKWKVLLNKPIFSSPCLAKDIIVVGCVDCYLYAIDKKGEIVWKFETNGPIFSSPVYTEGINDMIIFGSNDHSLYCLNLDGKILWKYDTASSIFASIGLLRSCVGEKKQYVNTERMKGMSCNINKPKEKVVEFSPLQIERRKRKCEGEWTDNDLNGIDGELGERYLESNDRFIVAVATVGKMYVLSSDGVIITSYTFPGEVYSSPVIVNDTIIIGCRDDNIYCLKLVATSEML